MHKEIPTEIEVTQQEIAMGLTKQVEQKYGDILQVEPPEFPEYPKMAMRDRAAQFAPFAALNGHKEATEDIAKLVEEEMQSMSHY